MMQMQGTKGKIRIEGYVRRADGTPKIDPKDWHKIPDSVKNDLTPDERAFFENNRGTK